jgi:N-acetylneuraminic acid mutarotase
MQQLKRFCIFLLLLIPVYLLFFSVHASAAENEWEFAPPLPTLRSGAQIVEVGGKLYAIGGFNNSGQLSVVEQFDPIVGKWTAKRSMNSIKSNYIASAALNNKIYAFSGTVVEEYDPSADTWTVKNPIPQALQRPSAVALNDKIYIFSVNLVQEYDPTNDSWTAKNNSAIDLSHTASVPLNGKIYVLGGIVELLPGVWTATNRSLVYDPVIDQWSYIASMKKERAAFYGAEAVDGKIYVFGGDNHYRTYSPTNAVERYDPATNTWTYMKDLPVALAGHDTALLGNKIYAIGGYVSDLNYNGYAPASYVYSVPVPTEPLESPTGVNAVLAESGVTLSWTPVPNATGYLIKRSDQSGGPYTQIGGVVSSTYGNTVVSATYSYSDTGPFSRVYNYYTVSAINSIGQSNNSNEALATMPPTIRKIQATTTGIELTWDSVPDPTISKFTLKRSTTSGGPYTAIIESPYPAFLDESNLQLGVTYYYIVSVTTAAGEINSREVSGALQPVTPANLTTTIQAGQVSLSWTGAYQAQSYTVKRATNSGGPYSAIATGITGTAYSDTNVQPGVTYYYIVTAMRMGHESNSSNEASATIPSTSSSGGLLKITMEEGTIKWYQLDSAKLNAFIDWFESRAYGIGPDAFGLDKGPEGAYSSVKHYILFNRIITFEVDTFKP